ncbi:MAG: prolipoprotein diacylglyceryl transferase [Sedimentisphaerales bacterium]|nr:prolipoprotein diacylglyceryl transferase [Sedimentisphaerales bacterium]
MHPQLITIPYINLVIPSYGFMMVLGFLSALYLARSLCRRLGENPEHITSFGSYALLAGVIGARIFHVIHNWSDYRDNLMDVLAVWNGGLEFLGGFIGALVVMVLYFRKQKLNIFKFLDILAPALMLGLAFGRVGCLLNGCCFGAPTDLPWGIRFPVVQDYTHRTAGCKKNVAPQYSIPFYYQITVDKDRDETGEPLLRLPDEYYAFSNGTGRIVYDPAIAAQSDDIHFAPLPPRMLSSEQFRKLQDGTYRMFPVHPTQIYSSLNALLICIILLFITLKFRKFDGMSFSLMLIIYGTMRFFLEFLRADNPLEFDGLTISQNLGIMAILTGIIMLLVLKRRRPVIDK